MKPFEVTVLGSNSAVPAYDRYPSAQILNVHDKLYLIDCGEGTQMQLNKYKIKRSRIEAIFISHLHGDHFFGVLGLLTSYHLLGRPDPLHLYAPPKLEKIIELALEASETRELSYELIFHPISGEHSKQIFENEDLTVHTLPLQHSVETSGFLFKEKEEGRKMKGEQLEKYSVPYDYIEELRKGKDFKDELGNVIKNEVLTNPPPLPRSYAYCSDTQYNESLLEYIMEVDLLYHEATFNKDARDRAEKTLHSTTEDAATIAKKANVKQLMIGHYSAKYRNLEPLRKEARAIFPNTILAKEGETVTIEQTERAFKNQN